MDMKKPFFHKGRFYNHEHDSLKERLWNMVKTYGHIAKQRLSGQGNTKVLLGNEDIKRWVVNDVLHSNHEDLLITWLGHATFLIQTHGLNILTDPVFYEISSFTARFSKIPALPHQLPPIDAVLISHNHQDHLDERSVLTLKKNFNPSFYVPQGCAKWFSKRGITNVFEATWWDKITFSKEDKTAELAFLPAFHWAGRNPFNLNKTLWGSWMITNNDQNIYFAGDTAYAKHFTLIKEQYPNIDVALLPIGPNEPRELLYDTHLSSEEAVQAFLDLGAKHFIPMHWATFHLGIDPFIAPLKRLCFHWNTRAEHLKSKVLHIVKCGEQRNFHDIIKAACARRKEGIF